jgi:hypothetical protein
MLNVLIDSDVYCKCIANDRSLFIVRLMVVVVLYVLFRAIYVTP